MSKKAVSTAAIWLLASLLIPAAKSLPAMPATAASPAADKLNVELVGHWAANTVVDLEVHGDRAFAADNLAGPPASGYVTVLDVSNASNPKQVVPAQRVEPGLYDFEILAASGDSDHIYLASDEALGDPDVRAFRRSDLQQACFRIVNTDRVVEMWSSGGHWFLVHGTGLGVLKPVAVQVLWCEGVSSYLVSGSGVTAAAYTASYAYLGTGDGRLIVLEITDPKEPEEKSNKAFVSGKIDAMAAAPGAVYLAQGTAIHKVDVSNPALPVKRESFSNPAAVTQLGAAGGHVYAASAGGIHVFDVSAGGTPTLAGYYLDPSGSGFGRALFLANDLVYTGGPGGMNILRFTSGAEQKAALLVQPTGLGGVLLNGEEVPYPCELQVPDLDARETVVVPACPECKAGDQLKLRRRMALLGWLACFLAAYDKTLETITAENVGFGEVWIFISIMEAGELCADKVPGQVRGPTTPHLVLEQGEGYLRYAFLEEKLRAEVKTGVVTVGSDGANAVGVDHDPQANRTTVRCYSGSLTLTPANSSLPPFTLGEGQQVEVTAGSVGPIEPIDYPYTAFLPLTLREAGSGPSGGWTTLLQEDFEGSFPGSWMVADGMAGYGEYHWASRTCRAHNGARSGWVAGGGADGAALSCGSDYPHRVESWMAAGPFDLSGGTAAELRFQRWQNTAAEDRLMWLASTDGVNFQGWQDSGTTGGWQETVFDLADVPGLGNLTGESEVWIGFVYSSDASTSLPEGAYVDDVVLRKYHPAAGTAGPVQPPGAGASVPDGLLPAAWVLPEE